MDQRLPDVARATVRALGRVCLCVAIVCAGARSLVAQTRDEPAGELPVYSVSFDNDAFAAWVTQHATDFEYTAGTHVRIRGPRAWQSEFEIGQELYTPRRNAPTVRPGDRPYAGLLYGAVRTHFAALHVQHTVTVLGGVIGPPAGGAEVQDAVHRLLGNPLRVGWPHQIATEPALGVAWSAERAVRTSRILPGVPLRAELAPQIGLEGGTLRSAARGALRAALTWGSTTAGESVPPYALDQTTRGRMRGPSGVSVTVWARYEMAWVAQNELLTSRVYGDVQPGTVPLPHVTTATVGIALRWGRYGVEYSLTRLGREYRTEPTSFRYGTVSFVRW
jgi:hypothetical protein